MVDQMTAQDRIQKALKELYGDEQALIVRNTTDGVVSVGFGELGNKGGKSIERSKLPIILTNEFPPDWWLESPDFRRAIAKGWLVLVSREDYDTELSRHQQRLADLKSRVKPEAIIAPAAPDVFSDDPSGEPMVIDETTTQLKAASADEQARRFMEYEGMETAPGPRPNVPAGVTVLGGAISSRTLSFCEEQKTGRLTNYDAIEWLDAEEKILSDDDLVYITGHSSFESIKSQARALLAERNLKK
jgi:hypothetical protein